jgi:hypothetical protein
MPKKRQGKQSQRGTVLHLDTFSGAAGNMFLGALLDAGLSRKALTEQLQGLGVPHRLVVRNVKRGAIAAKYLDVREIKPRAKSKAGHGHHHHRHYSHIRKILDDAKLEASVRERAHAIFRNLAEAEARVHGIPIEKVHFHEVGAVDAIVDVTGAAIALDLLGVDRVTATPVALGHGTVETEHGRLPLPAPATLELLKGIPTVPADVAWETVTPTGAAILRTIVDEFRTLPALTVSAIGHGAGNDRPGPMPNVLRAILGREGGMVQDRVVCLEANLDDFVPEHFDYVLEQLTAAGALDVSLQHIQMKKSRPGFLLRVIGPVHRRNELAARIVAETTTLGVRIQELDRLILPREIRRVETRYGRIAVKVSTRPDGQLDHSAEFDDCRRAAAREGVPLRDVIRAAEEAARA